MDAVSAYSLASLAWLTTQAIPLVVWPSLITTLLRIDSPIQSGVAIAALEQYFARSLGLAQLALAGLLLVQSGILPLDSAVDAPSPSTPGTSTIPASASAAVLVSALHHASTATYAYARYRATRQTGYLLGCLAGSALAAAGLWVLLFAGEAGRRVSRRTGADKSTSGWPFRNVEADRKRRKER